MTFFSRGKRDGRQLNLANTVIVNEGNDVWCLGYVQDIGGDYILIDFDCAKQLPTWIHSRHIWEHRLLDQYLHHDGILQEPVDIQIALRNEATGPYIFREAQILCYCSVKSLFLCYVRILCPAGNKNEVDSWKFVLVHHWQVVEKLPTNQPSLGALGRIPFVKYVLRSDMVNTIKAVQEGRMIAFLSRAFHGADKSAYICPLNQDRLFVRIKGDTVVFVFLEIEKSVIGSNEYVGTLSGREDMISAAMERFLDCYQNPKVESWSAPITYTPEPGNRMPRGHLHEVISEVLYYLDFHSQGAARKVCAFWNIVLTSPLQSICISFDFSLISTQIPLRSDTEGYCIGLLLDRCIKENTKGLALVNISSWTNHPAVTMNTISTLLKLKKVMLSVIMIRNCNALYELGTRYDGNGYMHHYCTCISVLMPICRRLVISSYTVRKSCCSCIYPGGGRADERWNVMISDTDIDCSATTQNTVCHYMNALERSLPCAQAPEDEFRDLHKRMVQSLPYPVGWQSFRKFLKEHTFSGAASSDAFWDSLDLRNFDDLPLSKFVLHMINANNKLATKSFLPNGG